MKRPILSRYDLTHDERVIIDISVSRIEDLYNSFDRIAAYVKKDLNEDFVDYVSESVQDIRGFDFVIRINVNQLEDHDKAERVRRSIHNYFHYLSAVEMRKVKRLLARSAAAFVFGLALLALTLLLAAGRPQQTTSMGWKLLSEGLTIAGWVMMWEAVANLIFDWSPHYQSIRLYRRIAASDVFFCFRPDNRASR